MDPFGITLLKYMKGGQVRLVIERDDGFSGCIDLSIFLSDYDDWPKYEKYLLKFVKGKVLDPGRGAGRYALWLRSRDSYVICMDIPPYMIKVAKMKGVEGYNIGNALSPPFRDGVFHTVQLLSGNLGVSRTYESVKRLLKKIHRMSVKGSVISASIGKFSSTHRYRFKLGTLVSEWFSWVNLGRDKLRHLARITSWEVIEFVDYGQKH